MEPMRRDVDFMRFFRPIQVVVVVVVGPLSAGRDNIVRLGFYFLLNESLAIPSMNRRQAGTDHLILGYIDDERWTFSPPSFRVRVRVSE